MTRPVLVLRPQPGADATATRARARGLEPIVAPLFRIAPLSWRMPSEPVEALLVTSANAARTMGAEPDRRMRVYAVGKATADALAEQGFADVVVGDNGVELVLAMAESAGVGSLLHLAGRDRTPFEAAGMKVQTRVVYAAEAQEPAAAFFDGLSRGAVALLHSARAARRFRELGGTGHRIAALSPAVMRAAGPGWQAAATASAPTDDALLAAAARLCQG